MNSRGSNLVAVLKDFEKSGDAMRSLNSRGQIRFKSTPQFLSRLADAEREVEDDDADSR
jgi:hypothetical protein